MFIVEYDGSRYHGSQYQANGRTIQGEIEEAVYKLTGEKTRISAASRTDAGVHAIGQVVSLRTRAGYPLQTWVNALNHYLDEDIAVRAAYCGSEGFDVRRHAVTREYRYSILNRPARSPRLRHFTYHVPHGLDVEAMNDACKVLVGAHDFAPFSTATDVSTTRRVHKVEVYREEDNVICDMVANSFLPQQVRNTVGGLIRVGQGQTSVDDFCRLARSGMTGVVGPAAPAHGLCLMKVNYRDFPPIL